MAVSTPDLPVDAPATPDATIAFKRKLGFWLGFGIVGIPFVFAWFTLRRGYSPLVRIFAFSWMSIYLYSNFENQIYDATHTPAEQLARYQEKAKEEAQQRKVWAEMDAKDAAKKAEKALGGISVQLDPNIADAFSLSCGRRDSATNFLVCDITNKMPIRASLRPLQFICYKSKVVVDESDLFEAVDANTTIRKTVLCGMEEYDTIVLRQKRRAY